MGYENATIGWSLLPSYKLGALCSAQEILRNSCASPTYIRTLSRAGEGFGVYVARSALLKLDTLPVGYTSECEQIPVASKQKDSELDDTALLFRIYPNPSNGVLSVEYTLELNEQGFLQVFDVVGSLIITHPLKNGETNQTIDLTTINSGVYLVRILVDGEVRLGQKITKFSE